MITTDIVIVVAIFVIASIFLFVMLELRTVRTKCEILENEIKEQYRRGFADGYDAAHSEHLSAVVEKK